MKVNYNKRPVSLGIMEACPEEYFSYTYLPIKLRDSTGLAVGERLRVFDGIIGRVACDYVGTFGLDNYVNSYMYITAKHAWQKKGSGFNRAGWHSDGFMSDDISYIWSNKQPTIFNDGDFFLTQDDEESMVEMGQQAQQKNNFCFPNNSIIRMDQFSIHRTGEYEEGVRAFIKIVFSKDKFDLQGNSHNYLLDYNWDMRPRRSSRNIPQIQS